MYYQSIKHCPNPIAIKPLYELLSKNESFGTNLDDIKCNVQLGVDNFFYVYNINNEPVGFFYLYEYPNDVEIVLGKFQHIEEKGFINFVLSQLDSALEQCGLKEKEISAVVMNSNPYKEIIIENLKKYGFIHKNEDLRDKNKNAENQSLRVLGKLTYILQK